MTLRSYTETRIVTVDGKAEGVKILRGDGVAGLDRQPLRRIHEHE